MTHASAHHPPPDGQSAILAGPGTVTVIDGLTFVVSDELGDVRPGPEGLMDRDTRHLSLFALRVDGERPGRLGASIDGTADARFHSFCNRHGSPDAPLEVRRHRVVRQGGFDETVELEWWGPQAGEATIELAVDADFADIFEVRRPAGDEDGGGRRESRWSGARLRLTAASGRRETHVVFSPPPDEVRNGTCRWRTRPRRGRPWRLRVAVDALPPAPVPVERLGSAHGFGTVVESAPPDLAQACRASRADLRRLTMADHGESSRRIIAAGIPWYVALFGRDSVIVALQTRAFDPGLLVETLGALAARQGRETDAGSEEEPGKILHEVRLSERPWLGEGTAGGSRPYFGSIDVTPLFVIALGVAWRWGAGRGDVERLLPAARMAMEWIRRSGDHAPHGFVTHATSVGRTLRNQGWKDSANGIQFDDGTVAEGPLALLEVQGYAYRARRELAAVLRDFGAPADAAALDGEADALRRAIRTEFWVPGDPGAPGFFAVALDGEGRRVDSVTSNMGHLLWSGVPTNDEAEQVARHLTGEAMASGWGLRTLSSDATGFNPISYHVGSVWPHDTLIACEGLRRYGLDGHALDLATGLLDALRAFDNRLPELYGGHARDGTAGPVPYPAACRPQAWAAGVPLGLVTLFLGLEPEVPRGMLSLQPVLPSRVERLSVRGIRFPGGELAVDVDHGTTSVRESPPGVTVALRPRPQAPAANPP